MRRKNITGAGKSRAFLAMLLVFVSLSLGPLPGLVVCLEAGGAVAVEAAHNGACSIAAAEKSEGTDTIINHRMQSVVENHCGPCVDIPIFVGDGTDEDNVATLTGGLQTIGILTPACPPRQRGSAADWKNTYPENPQSGTTTLDIIRTVILIV